MFVLRDTKEIYAIVILTYMYLVTWYQAQFEWFSYILSNGYRHFVLPARV